MNLKSEDINFKEKQILIGTMGGDNALRYVREETIAVLKRYIGKRPGKVFNRTFSQLTTDLKVIGKRCYIVNLTSSDLLKNLLSTLPCLSFPDYE